MFGEFKVCLFLCMFFYDIMWINIINVIKIILFIYMFYCFDKLIIVILFNIMFINIFKCKMVKFGFMFGVNLLDSVR